LQLERISNGAFPSATPFRKLGRQVARIAAIRRYVAEHPQHADVLPYLPSGDSDIEPDGIASSSEPKPACVDGFVYLLKFGKHYKIGRTEAVPTRHRQINLELPEKAVLVHKIGTDDCAGIEAYWHQRFAAKRTNGEWLVLTRPDVSAFKRRKFM
jgi:hypothetical protein